MVGMVFANSNGRICIQKNGGNIRIFPYQKKKKKKEHQKQWMLVFIMQKKQWNPTPW